MTLLIGANRRFKFHKHAQLFIGVRNETLSVVAMRVNNQDRAPIVIHGGDTACAACGRYE